MKTNSRVGFWVHVFVISVVGMGGFSVQRAEAASCPLTFYIPIPEQDYLLGLTEMTTGITQLKPVNPVTTYISIAAVSDNTIIRYDHWEDGYDKAAYTDTPLQPTTEVWGDNNPTNGMPPGFTNDLIKAGSVILLYNQLDTTNALALDYDGRDKIISDRAISVTRTFWASGSVTKMAGCVEVFDTVLWGMDYRAPVGEDIPDVTDAQMFEYTALSVMASASGTVVRIDKDANGMFEATNTLNEGETLYVNGGVNVGGTVLSTKPVQVVLLTGNLLSAYESRDSSLLPVNNWSTSYYTPVSTRAGDGTRVWLYNPDASEPLTVYCDYRIGTNSLTVSNETVVAANSYAAVLLPEYAGAHFYSTNSPRRIFYAYSTTDSDSPDINGSLGSDGNQSWDWSFTLFPRESLSPQVVVGLGIGRDPSSAVNTNENGNPVWVTPVGNGETPIEVYVDFNGDNVGPYTDPNGFHFDTNYPLKELQQQMIYDSDGDQTAMLIYVLSTNVMLAVAWGQDPRTATAAQPGLDVGTSVPPQDVLDVDKKLTIAVDANGDGQLSPADRAQYLIEVANSFRAVIPAALAVQDAVPDNTTYVPDSTEYRPDSTSSWIAVSDDASGTLFPLDGSGMVFQVSVLVSNVFAIRYQVDVAAYSNLPSGVSSIINTGSVRSIAFNRTLIFRNETSLHGSLGDRVWEDANTNGIQDVGEAGITGVVVYLDVNTNGVREAYEPVDTTDSGGYYLFAGPYLLEGNHDIRVDSATLPAGYVATYDLDGTGTLHAASATLSAGQVRVDVDFGYAWPMPAVRIVKTAGSAPDGAVFYASYGSNVVFRYHVENMGESFLVNLVVTDDVLGSVGTVAGPLAPGASFDLYKTNLALLSAVTNIGTVVATPSASNGTPILALSDVTDSDDAIVLLALEIRGIVWKENLGIIDGVKSNDVVYPDVLVTLLQGGTDGVWTAGATTDANGAYAFTNVTTGVAYTVQFTVPKTNNLYTYFAPSASYVIADGTNRETIGNDAIHRALTSNDVFGVASVGPTQIVYGALVYVDAGLGTNDPTHTLSTSIRIQLYETADGLFVELYTVDEVAAGEWIELSVLFDGQPPQKIGQVRSLGGSQRYLVRVEDPAVFARGGVFTLIVIDESGARHDRPGMTVTAFKAQSSGMTKQGFTLTWASLPGRVYDIFMCTRLGESWRKVAANIQASGDTCSAVVPLSGEQQAFFKIEMQVP